MAKIQLSGLSLILKKMATLAMATFATKEEVAALTGAQIVTEQEAHAIWTNYVFATTDSDSNNGNGNESGGEEESGNN